MTLKRCYDCGQHYFGIQFMFHCAECREKPENHTFYHRENKTIRAFAKEGINI